MKLILTIGLLSCLVVICAADNSGPLNGGQTSETFEGGFSNPIAMRVAKQFVTNRHKVPSAYNPCDHKECSPGYSCKVISNQYLLQVSVAVCVPDNVAKIADNPPCITIVLGGGQMGCKTQEEWENIGKIQCGVRVTSNVAYHHATKAHQHCPYNRHKPEHTFMQAIINCCPGEATPTGTVSPTTPNDGHNLPDFDANEQNEQDSPQKRNKHATFIIVASLAFAVVGLALLMFGGCFAYKKTQQKLPTKLDPVDGGMSFINHNSDAYEESNFDPKKPLVMYPAGADCSKDYIVENPLVSSK